ncbi:hypothetical protein WJX79_006151 [Trebouxia sp. C0005]
MPASSEVEDFTDQVDEACRLIAGLQAGSVSPEDFDRREAVKQSSKHVTDYTKWDFFTPDDEDDDLINSLTPNNPQLKAMEADIDARHARMVSQRQLAERQRVEGNALYAQGQFNAAFQCYETGLDAERHNMALHSNAAQVLLKMGCHAQAIEHCDKVLHLSEFLHNRPSDPICAKALWRRATARKELKHFSEAYRDLQQALELEPANKPFAKELERLKQDCAEQRKQRAVLKQIHNADSQLSNASTASIPKQTTEEPQGRSCFAGEPVNDLQRVQQLTQALHIAGEKLADPRAPPVTTKGPSGLGKGLPLPGIKGTLQSAQKEVEGLCTELAALLHANEDCRVCLRECTGLSTLYNLLLKELGAACSPVLRALTAACQNDYNCRGNAGTQAMALSVLGNCATQPDVLKAVSTSCDAGGQLGIVTVTKLLSSQDTTMATKAATLVGNLCHDSVLRSQITSSRAAVASLLAVLSCYSSQNRLPGSCLSDSDAQSLVIDLQGIAIVAKLLSPLNWLLAARAAGILARLAQQPTGDLAREPQLLALLQQEDAVAPLLDVAYKCKGPTQKNAAIAVARLAHDQACMQRIRELHGLEIIYQYVKP